MRNSHISRVMGFAGAWLLLAPPNVIGQTTERVSVDATGAQGNSLSGYLVMSISGDGRHAAFYSVATNLVIGDTNFHGDVFVHDRVGGGTELVSVNTAGVEGNGESDYPSISTDGRYVAFVSQAQNLVANDLNGAADVFLRDRITNTTERVSLSSSGAEVFGSSWRCAISADGRCVAFESLASTLVSADTNGVSDVFVRDRLLGTTERVSVGLALTQANAPSYSPAISADGRFVAFRSEASNLVPGDTNGTFDVFVHDRQTGATELVSVGLAGVPGNGQSIEPSLSADGRFVAFQSAATDLVPGDSNAAFDVFVRDRLLGTTERVSIDASGTEGNGNSTRASISADGRRVVFQSLASNLVPGDTNATIDVFLHDRQTGATVRINLDSAGNEANNFGAAPAISADGQFVLFNSMATNLVPGDTNNALDVFEREHNPAGFTSTCQPGFAGVLPCPCANPPGGLGRGCDNSSATGGATLSAAGIARVSADSLVFQTSGERPTALSILVQGNGEAPAGISFGQGVRCVAGLTRRLFTKTSAGGSMSAPGPGDPSISARSAALGDLIQGGQPRWYFVYYRDPLVLGGCPASATFNCTQTGRIDWAP